MKWATNFALISAILLAGTMASWLTAGTCILIWGATYTPTDAAFARDLTMAILVFCGFFMSVSLCIHLK